jgi:hypothetical protein
MKNWKQWVLIGILAIIVFAIIACGDDNPDPEPVKQSKNITIADGKTVTVNFTALPDTTPIWWNTLEDVFHNLADMFDIGHYTLNVNPNGTDGFVVGEYGTKTATVSDVFLSTSDYATMRQSMGPMVNDWII